MPGELACTSFSRCNMSENSDVKNDGLKPLPPKVFGIGFQKTGTSSLHRALEHLGYTVQGHFELTPPDIERKIYEKAEELLPQYQAFEDTPWPLLYRYLDERAPGSRFILTVRDPDRWIRSVVSHFGPNYFPIHEWIYGCESAAGHEDVWLARYRKHNEEVREYFAARPDDLLVLDLAQGNGWEALCSFLDKPVPDIPFPMENALINRKNRRIRRTIQRFLGIEEFMRERHARRRAAQRQRIKTDRRAGTGGQE